MLALLSIAGSYPYMTGPLTLFFSSIIHSHECHFYTFPLYTKLKPIPKSHILVTQTIPDRSLVHTSDKSSLTPICDFQDRVSLGLETKKSLKISKFFRNITKIQCVDFFYLNLLRINSK